MISLILLVRFSPLRLWYTLSIIFLVVYLWKRDLKIWRSTIPRKYRRPSLCLNEMVANNRPGSERRFFKAANRFDWQSADTYHFYRGRCSARSKLSRGAWFKITAIRSGEAWPRSIHAHMLAASFHRSERCTRSPLPLRREIPLPRSSPNAKTHFDRVVTTMQNSNFHSVANSRVHSSRLSFQVCKVYSIDRFLYSVLFLLFMERPSVFKCS